MLESYPAILNNYLIVGALLSVALAIAADGALVLVERALTPWSRAR